MHAHRPSRRAAMASASLAVIAALLPSQPTRAQAFQGTPVVSFGSVSIDRTTPNVDNIFIGSTIATINWTPTDSATGGGPIAFLGSNGIVNYASVEQQPYTVLNRIIAADPSRVISFDGRVNSDAAGAIWFYAPGGILIGGKGSFNVGSLLLTANDPVTDANGGFDGNSFSLLAGSGSKAAITISPGARISAGNAGSYVIAVAPRIDQGGAIDVNGAAALVAAEAVDLTLNAGLFDITATTGTAAGGQVISQTGQLTGGAAGAGAAHRIYLVAMPKNDAITLFVGGSNSQLGFDIAGAADVVGNAIVLSAGRNIAGGVIAGAPSQVRADVTIEQGLYTSALTASSTGETRAASLSGDTTFASNLDLTGLTRAEVSAAPGFTIKISGDASLSTSANSPDIFDGADRLGGVSRLAADGGNLTVTGNLVISADGQGNASADGRGGTGTGGTAEIATTSAGTLSVVGATTASAQGFGGNDDSVGGGDGIGGTVTVATSTGNMTLGGGLSAIASGSGGNYAGDAVPTQAPRGTGGRVEIRAVDGPLDIGGALTARAEGIGNTVDFQGGLGNAAGGTAILFADTAQLAVAGTTIVSADAIGSGSGNGASFDGGSGKAGTAQILAGEEGSISLNGVDAWLSARGFSGSSSAANGGIATGGTAQVLADRGVVRMNGSGAFTVSATAFAGDGQSGGSAGGGAASIEAANGGQVGIAPRALVEATVFGGDSTQSGNGGNAAGGSASVLTRAGQPSSISFASRLDLTGTAQAGSAGGDGNGGNALGGQARVQALAGSITALSPVNLAVQADGGAGGLGGTATGGAIDVEARGSVIAFGDVLVTASANGGAGTEGSGGIGGAAAGATVTFRAVSDPAAASRLTAGAIGIEASAIGGAGGAGAFEGDGGRGGDARGAAITLTASAYDAGLTTGGLVLAADARGGTGGEGGDTETNLAGTGGDGGNAIGGTVTAGTSSDGSGQGALTGFATFGAVDGRVFGTGGNGGNGQAFGGAGGSGTGGSALVLLQGGTLNAGALDLAAFGVGGNGGAASPASGDGAAGNGSGGKAGFAATPHLVTGEAGVAALASLRADASARDGQGRSFGGNATGGEALLTMGFAQGGAAAAASGVVTFSGAIELDATASARGEAERAGTATGGRTRLAAAAGSLTVAGAVTLDSSADGAFALLGDGGTASGGTTSLAFDGGTVRFDATVDLLADAFGGFAVNGRGGAATGGRIAVATGPAGGAATFAAAVEASAAAQGGGGRSGGDASGGVQTLTSAASSTLTFDSGLMFLADALGGEGNAGAGGAAAGGTVTLVIGGSARTSGTASIDVSATGGLAGLGGGGNGLGGTASIDASGGTFAPAVLDVVASGRGGASSNGVGGTGSGGTALLSASLSGQVAIEAGHAVAADGTGGDGTGNGATGTGGTIRSSAAGGRLAIGGIQAASARGLGGTGSTGGTGTGGTVFFGATDAPGAGTATVGQRMTADASGQGGGALGNTGGAGGLGRGGRVDVVIDAPIGAAELSAADMVLAANGIGGAGSTLQFGEGFSSGGSGGDGFGGIVVSGSTSSAGAFVAGDTELLAQGIGGDGGSSSFGNGGRGGSGIGGEARAGSGSLASARTGSLGWTTLTLRATGSGGSGGFGNQGNDGTGGDGTGGRALHGVNGGVLQVSGATSLSADGAGGPGGEVGGGGNGMGGTARAFVAPHSVAGGASSINGAALAITASGFAGGSGGTAAYGSAIVDVIGGSSRYSAVTLAAEGATGATPGAVSGVATRRGTVTIDGPLSVTSPGDLVLGADVGSITVGGALAFGAGGSVAPNFDGSALVLPGVVRARSIDIRAGRRIVTTSLTSSSSLALEAQQSITANVLVALGTIGVEALGAVTLGDITGGGASVIIDAGSDIVAGNIRGAGDIGLFANGSTASLTAGSVSAGDSIVLEARGGGITTLALDAGIVAASTDPEAAYQIGVFADGAVRTGALAAQGNIGLFSTAAAITAGDVTTARSVLALGVTDIATGGIVTGPGVGDAAYLGSIAPYSEGFGFNVLGAPGGFEFGSIVAVAPAPVSGTITVSGGVTAGIFRAASLGALTVGGAVATRSILALDGGTLLLGDVYSGGLLSLISASDLTVGDIRADGDLILTTPGRLTTGQASAGDSVFLTAGGDITAAGIDAGIDNPAETASPGYDVLVQAGGAALIGNVGAAGSVVIVSKGGNLATRDLSAGRSVALLAAGGITTGGVATGGDSNVLMANDSMATLVAQDSNGNLDLGALLAASAVALDGPVSATGPIVTGTLTIAATGGVTIPGSITTRRSAAISGGALALGGVTAGGLLTLAAADGLSAGALRGDGDIDVRADAGDVEIGSASAGDSIRISALGGRVATGALDAGIVGRASNEDAGYQIGIVGADGVDVAVDTTLRALGSIGIQAPDGNVATGAATTGRSFVVLAAGDVATGAVTTGTTAADHAYIGHASILEQLPNLQLDPLGPSSGFDFAPLFALAPVRIDGAATLGGPVLTGTFDSASARGFNAGGITASQRIAIDTGRTARFGGAVVAPLIAINSADIAIDSEASIGNATTTQLSLRVDSTASAIRLGGTLSAGEGIAWQLDAAEIARLRAGQISVDVDGSSPPVVEVEAFVLTGTAGGASGNANFALTTPRDIRVTGTVTASGLAPGDTLRLRAGTRLTVVTDRGGALRLTGGGAADTAASLGGVLDLTANQIWIGTAALLGQLAENAGFAGRDAALGATPATTDLPGAIGASSILVGSASFLIQNSGDATRRAGFSVGPAGLQISSRNEGASDVVINGRAFDGAGATLLNNDTIGLVGFKPAVANFTATSSVNGCLISGVCTTAPEPQPEGPTETFATIATQVRELTIERRRARDAARDPVERFPQLRFARLIDLAPAISNPAIDEPITSGGNSSLWLDSDAPPPDVPAPGEQK